MAGLFWMLTGCSGKTAAVEGAPPHHTADGFRNYPPAPRPEMPGISFLFRRIRDLYEKPVFPQDHVRGYPKVQELDWHQSAEMGKLKLTAMPAVHFSGRGVGDRNKTLWCSWVIESADKRYFFAGDTAYSPTIFKKIGDRFRSFDTAIVPIGAYEPVNVMKPVHTNPEEAVQIANDVNADVIIPSHWGTITLTDEPPWEPLERYRACAAKLGISSTRASTMKIGETKII